MSLFVFLVVVLVSIGVAATTVVVIVQQRLDKLEKKIDAATISKTDVEEIFAKVWADSLAGTIEELTSEDTLALALSRMSEEQMDRLADKTAKLREENGQ